MSAANRETYAVMVSIFLICGFYKQQEGCTNDEKILCDKIQDLVKGPKAACLAFTVDAKAIAKINERAKGITYELCRKYAPLTVLNMWIGWCEERIEATNHPSKKAFFEELHDLLHCLYLYNDLEYQNLEFAADAVTAMKELRG